MKKCPRIFISIIMLILFFPIILTFIYSIATNWHSTIIPEGITFMWYKELFQDSSFLNALLRTLLVSLSTVILSIVIMVPTIYIISVYFPKWEKAMQSVVLLPYAIPGVISSVGLLQIYSKPPFLLTGTVWLLIGAYFIIILPFMYQGIKNSLRNINVVELVQAAELLGASKLQAFLNVVLPNIISGILVDFDGGNIVIDDVDVTNIKPKDRQVAMVFQSYALFPNMTVYENIEFGLRMKKLGKKEISRKVAEIIEVVELKGKENNYPSELSGGQQQRVALARSIVTEPKILLLDEPLSALDAKIRKSLQRQIRNIQKKLNITTIFVTHDQEEAMTMSDRIIIMDKGNIAQIGTPEEIYIRPANEFVARFIGNYNVYNNKESKSLFDGKITSAIAIRPEVITISNSAEINDDYYCIEADFINKYMVGSVIRYELAKNNSKILVDALNKNPLTIGSKLVINIPKNDIIYLEENNIVNIEAVV